MLALYRPVCLLLIVGLAGCGMPLASENTTAAAVHNAISRNQQPGAEYPPQGVFLVVGNNDGNSHLGSVGVFDGEHGKMPAQTITKGIATPNGFAFDSKGDLYVANNGNVDVPGSVVEYAPHTAKIVRTITAGISTPDKVIVDASDDVIVANFLGNTVTVYGPQGTQPLRTISTAISGPEDLDLDSKGDLFVTNYEENEPHGRVKPGWISEYAPGSTKLLTQITKGIDFPATAAFNASGSLLYVANGRSNTVTVYDSSTFKLVSTITQDIAYPESLGFDALGNLYVLCSRYGPHSFGGVLVFPAGSVTHTAVIATGIHYPGAMVLDRDDDVYVGNLKKGDPEGRTNFGSVSIYSAGTYRLVEQIKRPGIDGAAILGLGTKE
jgi:YVTN family beta-propeller protein